MNWWTFDWIFECHAFKFQINDTKQHTDYQITAENRLQLEHLLFCYFLGKIVCSRVSVGIHAASLFFTVENNENLEIFTATTHVHFGCSHKECATAQNVKQQIAKDMHTKPDSESFTPPPPALSLFSVQVWFSIWFWALKICDCFAIQGKCSSNLDIRNFFAFIKLHFRFKCICCAHVFNI